MAMTRKRVTIVFCDVAGSTALGESIDPEALRSLLARYFERMRGIVSAHGGTVEKFIGDAVMAVFGVPVLHEDDALRAVRAAAEMRDALPELGLQARIGVNSGEVVTGTEERLATGDAVNVAARLEQAAAPGEVILGADTLRLVRDSVDAEALDPLELKGKSEPVGAYRLLAVHQAAARRSGSTFVGRADELELLRRAVSRTEQERTCLMFTLLGTAGVGKSRLVEELLASLDGPRVVRGRCLSYGEGITYYPVVEVLLQLLSADPDATLAKLLPDAAAASALQGLLGADAQPSSPQDAAWAFRKLLEAVAHEQPLVVVLDDVHWGEPAFLDLVEHVADLSRDAPILLLCVARSELLEKRPGWAGGMLNATTTLLEPLPAEATEELFGALLSGEVIDERLRARIRDAAVGNPLFLEEMVAMVRESGNGDVSVPPTIHALLAARLDQLPAPERGVLERGAVEGKEFHRGAVVALAPEEPDADAHLTRLVRKDLIRPERPTLSGEDAYRFRHLLIRDAAYDALPKATRAELHERFTAWLAERGGELIESDEILGYHLEQAYRYKAELGQADPQLGARAAERLAEAGTRALAREDIAAAANLLSRAASLYPEGDPRRAPVLYRLGDALIEGAEFARAEATLSEAVELAADEPIRLLAEIERRYALGRSQSVENAIDETAEAAARALPVFEAAGDHAALARAWRAIGDVDWHACRWEKRAATLDRALEHARLAGDTRAVKALALELSVALTFGPTPIEEVERRAGTLFEDESGAGLLAFAAAGRGDLDEARRLAHERHAQLVDRGQRLRAFPVLELIARIEDYAGNLDRVVTCLRESCAGLEAAGEMSYLSTVSAEFARLLCDYGRFDEAHERAETGRRLARADDVSTQCMWRMAEALVHVDRGDVTHAESLAREAIALLAETDMIEYRGHASRALARVLEAAGRRDEAAAAAREALSFYEQKGLVVPAERARADLSRLGWRVT
ncbi:MAG TPA: adenylate/guanylate cyclase domain-containing protein [Solirubrobacteraceae bacterium]|nr:adenylate/guanylate cyclase domain-containing protein [Solirubrobacteraceae bacterium]